MPLQSHQKLVKIEKTDIMKFWKEFVATRFSFTNNEWCKLINHCRNLILSLVLDIPEAYKYTKHNLEISLLSVYPRYLPKYL